jgi:hypothetical protein
MVSSTSPSAVLPIEIGSLSTSSPHESQFFGSSSGVFFVKTVLQAFANSEPGSPRPEDRGQEKDSPSEASVNNCISDQNNREQSRDNQEESSSFRSWYASTGHRLGQPPITSIAKELIMVYFERWHPIFPFLHGPTFVDEVESFYANGSNFQNSTNSHARENARQTILFQCIFNLAALDCPDIILPPISQIESPMDVMSLIGIVSTKHDTPSIQALLAAQLYLIATMSLHAASTVGGILLRSIFHAGFHRCPFRYAQLSRHDCDIRKRIFWCAYATDRYLSQALGHPLGFQDSDIDVCVPGIKDLHRRVPPRANSKNMKASEKSILLHLPDGHPEKETRPQNEQLASDSNPPDPATPETQSFGSPAESKLPVEDALAAYVSYGRITGRALELFHKSIHNRTVEHGNILTLSSEVHAWWNSLPQHLQDLNTEVHINRDSSTKQQRAINHTAASFFTVIYQQLILLVNRPFLSMRPTTPEFQSSIQTCIGASRTIISTLRGHDSRKMCLSAPGMLSSIWMSGLVIAFACELNRYPFTKGLS